MLSTVLGALWKLESVSVHGGATICKILDLCKDDGCYRHYKMNENLDGVPQAGVCPSLKSTSKLGGCLIDWKRLSTWRASQKFYGLSWSGGMCSMPQNLEYAKS